MSNTQVARFAAPAEKVLNTHFVHVKHYMEEEGHATSMAVSGITPTGRQKVINIWEYVHAALAKEDEGAVHQFFLPHVPGKTGVMFHRDFITKHFAKVHYLILTDVAKKANKEAQA